jgi:uncharacterized membrane protein (DUF2068 family)
MSKSLKIIGCLKVLRGSIAIAIGSSLFSVYLNFEIFNWAEHPMLKSLATKDPLLQILFSWLASITGEQLLHIAILGGAMGFLLWIEAVGIWFNRSWAEWLAVFSGLIYIPFEVNELIYRFNWMMVLILLINVLVVGYLAYVLNSKRLSFEL